MSDNPAEDAEERELNRLVSKGYRITDADTRSRVQFSEVKGLCRTCSRAMIRRRQYSEVPQVICQVNYEHPHRVPLDIMECTDYRRQGEMDVRDMHQIALIIDAREKGGQYL
mgnify:CR=1 FL=1